MPNNFEVSGPAFVGLFVHDVVVAADFYEKKIGFRRDLMFSLDRPRSPS